MGALLLNREFDLMVDQLIDTTGVNVVDLHNKRVGPGRDEFGVEPHSRDVMLATVQQVIVMEAGEGLLRMVHGQIANHRHLHSGVRRRDSSVVEVDPVLGRSVDVSANGCIFGQDREILALVGAVRERQWELARLALPFGIVPRNLDSRRE